MARFSDLLNQKVLGNEIENYLWFIGIIAAGLLLKRFMFTFFGRLAFRLISRNEEPVNSMDFLRILGHPVQAIIFLIFLYVATRRLELPEIITKNPEDLENIKYIVRVVYRVTFILMTTWLGFRILNLLELILTRRVEQNKSALNIKIIPFVKEVSKFVLVIISS
ncbi:MAG: hypothetical protein M3512_18255, partial [Bacteroidota bacterium]|nr:hypothetical protein [Bacteroidota bacterium]